MRIFRYCYTLCAVAIAATNVVAQPFSYIYIQGDKQTPFYVKMEGKMMPRYGGNYNIISELNPGPVHLEILFQQRMFPSQKFTIVVPENSCRGFLLNKQGNDSFALYDLQRRQYLTVNDETIQTGK